MDNFRDIIVKPGVEYAVTIINPTNFELLGKGAQGAVFKLSDERCVKIYAHRKHASREAKALKAAKHAFFIPRVYEAGANYIVMEFVKGPSLREYLKEKGHLPDIISKQMLNMLKEMKRLGFTRVDTTLRHIIVTEGEKIKVVDHVNAYKKQVSTPQKLFSKLSQLGFLDSFLRYVKQADPSIFQKWKKSMSKANRS